MSAPPHDPWHALGRRTPARIAIGRAGASMPTREVLAFALAHARARDAVHATLDRDALGCALASIGLPSMLIESAAADRATYLRRPDLGRQLSEPSREQLSSAPRSNDIALVIADGLSATAVSANAMRVVTALLPHFTRLGLTLSPILLAQGARVALGDEVGAILCARLVVVLIGERPGLSASDSSSAYLTYAPRIGRSDAERNCVSNIRCGGLEPAAAAHNIAWLVEAALSRQLTGVTLKDGSDALGVLPADVSSESDRNIANS